MDHMPDDDILEDWKNGVESHWPRRPKYEVSPYEPYDSTFFVTMNMNLYQTEVRDWSSSRVQNRSSSGERYL